MAKPSIPFQVVISVTDAPINQPYLGTTPADIDVESANDWVLDDKKEHKDEGASQLLADDQLSASNDLLDLDKAKMDLHN